MLPFLFVIEANGYFNKSYNRHCIHWKSLVVSVTGNGLNEFNFHSTKIGM